MLDPVTEAFEAAYLPIASLEQPTEPEDSASDSNAFAQLPWTSRELAPIITELPHQARDKLLSLLANPKFDARDIIWKNAAQLDVFLDDNAAQVRV